MKRAPATGRNKRRALSRRKNMGVGQIRPAVKCPSSRPEPEENTNQAQDGPPRNKAAPYVAHRALP